MQSLPCLYVSFTFMSMITSSIMPVNSFVPAAVPRPVVNLNSALSSATFAEASVDSFQRAATPHETLLLNDPMALRRFAVFGDSGTGEPAQYTMAEAMRRTFLQKPFASALMMGDNVYPNGEPERFEQAIGAPYRPLQAMGTRFYPVLGNHDIHLSQGDAQLRYWGVPRFYNQRLGNTEIFALDTTLFFPGYGRHGYVPNPAQTAQMASRELTWLDSALKASNAKYKVVYGHYPLYSMEEHNEPPGMQAQLRWLLEPVMARNAVTMYLAGHNHDYEKTGALNSGIQHFVSGAGGRLREKPLEPVLIAPIQKVIAERHFMFFEEKSEGLSYQVLNKDGLPLDSGVIPPR